MSALLTEVPWEIRIECLFFKIQFHKPVISYDQFNISLMQIYYKWFYIHIYIYTESTVRVTLTGVPLLKEPAPNPVNILCKLVWGLYIPLSYRGSMVIPICSQLNHEDQLHSVCPCWRLAMVCKIVQSLFFKLFSPAVSNTFRKDYRTPPDRTGPAAANVLEAKVFGGESSPVS